MSTYGVRVRFIDMLVGGHGVIHDEEFRSLIEYARERGVTAGEARALLQPAEYLETSRVLRGHGIRLEDVRFDPEAWQRAQALARELGIEAPLSRLPNAQPGTAPTPSPTESEPSPPRDLAQALSRGKKLGSPDTWRLQTAGATVSFSVRAGETVHPAVILDAPQWSDPAPRDLVAEERTAVRELRELPALVQLIRSLVTKHRAYFDAADVKTRSRNELFGIQDLRRHAFFSALGKAVAESPLGRGGPGPIQAVLLSEKERLLCNRDYLMEVGSHTNYWPYWDNYLPVLQKMLAQTAPRTDAWYALKNRIEDVLNHKTVFGFERAINERSVETSVGAALVHRLPWSEGNGHRVSVAPASGTAAPVYEVLSVHSPPDHDHAQYAGAPVFRDSDGTLRFDRPGTE
ncbi:MAG TPA: hypothetical protein VF815_38505, partial [Myxococcaceae bacterium]